MHFMDDSFVNLVEYKAVCTKAIQKGGSIPTLLWQSGASESATVTIRYWQLCGRKCLADVRGEWADWLKMIERQQ